MKGGIGKDNIHIDMQAGRNLLPKLLVADLSLWDKVLGETSIANWLLSIFLSPLAAICSKYAFVLYKHTVRVLHPV